MNRMLTIITTVVMLIMHICGSAESVVNVTEKLWEEDTLNISKAEAMEDKDKKGPVSDDSIFIDVLDLKDMDIFDVLKLISQKSGLNIVAGQNVKGKVTVFLKNVEVYEVLRIIVEAYGWAYEQEEGIMRIMTSKEYIQKHGFSFNQKTETRIKQLTYIKAEDALAVLNQIKGPSGKVIADPNSGILILTDEPKHLDAMEAIIMQMDIAIKTEVFTLSYADAQNLSTEIGEMITPSIGKVKFDDRTNRIIVSDTAANIEKVRTLIDAFDRKDKEVLIESKIMQVTLSDEYKLGVNWEGVVEEFHNLNLRSDFDVLTSTEKRGQLSIGTLASDNYTALVQALETVGNTNILSSPRIAAVNNQEAKILVGSTEPYVTTTTTTPSAGPTTTAEAVNFIDVGVKLFVTPTIHEDDFITMKIKPEVSSVTSNLTTSNNNTIPIVETSEAETVVTVKDRVTIVIGGLIKEETIDTRKQIPLLGKIPVLGYAFRSQDNETSKTEIVIFLTPRIITGDVDQSDQLVAF